ncbi:MAG TPA: hypothetical protein PKI20_20730 [Verrucomicrobiota bacterium]|jgi:hypothetical protein|nr:hypothetical protein [Verrucomicrobiota bacterium]HQL80110.1 hypothetical protein [Verrucomicrobiota bacterium]
MAYGSAFGKSRRAAWALCAAALAGWLAGGENLPAADWVRAGLNTNQPIWGLRGGLLWAVPPGGFRAASGPRGLIRVGYPIATNGGYRLINFIAVEPIVRGQRGFSELEMSSLDDARGKRIWPVAETGGAQSALVPGRLSQPAPGVEQLEVSLQVEPFENGARVRLGVSQRSDAPDEIRLAVRTDTGSAPLEYCILTATMGNLARTRLLWLKDEVVSSLRLHPDYRGTDFAPHHYYTLDRLARTPAGDVLAAITTDEDDPARVYPFPGRELWHYGGTPVTQYWKKPRGTARDDLHLAVNARHTYWQSRRPIPGGVAFENFELRERFHEGQAFIFGITSRPPKKAPIKDWFLGLQ